MTDSDRYISTAALALHRSEKLSTTSLHDLLLKWGAESRTFTSVEDALDAAGFARPPINKSVSDAERDAERSFEAGIRLIPICSELYPATLRSILDAPPILHVRGDLSVLKRLPGVAVVGTRKASRHGLLISERVSEYFSAEGWVVVSGLALGIDAAAHEGALRGGTPTIAVLAHGLEKAQPTTNQPLAQRILEAGGAWVSEHVIGTPAKPPHFVLRNRIQVGLSCASVIVEGEEQSGSATQAEFCLRNRRLLYVVLPDPKSNAKTASALPRMLHAKRGAVPIYSRDDYPAVVASLKRAAMTLQETTTVPDIHDSARLI